jgi:hypothetical protein
LDVGTGHRHFRLEAVEVLMMRFPSVSLLVVASALAGCAGAANVPAAKAGNATASSYVPLSTAALPASALRNSATRPRWMRTVPPGQAEPVELFVSQVYSTQLYGYDVPNKKNAPPNCTYSPGDYVNNMAFDAQGNLWAPEGENRTIIEYGPDCGQQIGILYDSIGQPDAIAFDHAGHQWISNLQNLNGANGSVVEYVKGKVVTEVQDPTIEEMIGLTMDKADNVWVSFIANGSFSGNIAEFPKGKEPATLFANISLGFPGSVQFDRRGNLIGINQLVPQVEIFAPPYTGAPASTFPLEGAGVDCTLSHNEKLLYCGDYTNGSADVYAYPSGTYEYSFTTGLVSVLVPTGVAVWPSPPY